MSKSNLQKLDFQLCEYIRGNVLSQTGGDRFMLALSSMLELPLTAYLGLTEADDDDQHERLLLTVDDIIDLQTIVADLSDRFRLEWEPYAKLHARWIASVREIRTELSIPAAEDWSQLSAEFVRQLEQPHLSLEDGIHITGEWIDEIRRYLAAMGRRDLIPYPDGCWPTPTNPSPSTPVLFRSDLTNSDEGRDLAVAPTANIAETRLPEGRSDLQPLPLKDELSLRETATVLGCDTKTVIHYIDDGVLEWRNAAPPSSTRKLYKLKTESVLNFRNSYRLSTTQAADSRPASKPRKRLIKSSNYQPKHIRQKPIK